MPQLVGNNPVAQEVIKRHEQMKGSRVNWDSH